MVNQNTSERQVIETALSIFKNFSNLEEFDSSLSLALKKYFNFPVPSTEINDALHVYNIIEHIKKVSKGIPSLLDYDHFEWLNQLNPNSSDYKYFLAIIQNLNLTNISSIDIFFPENSNIDDCNGFIVNRNDNKHFLFMFDVDLTEKGDAFLKNGTCSLFSLKDSYNEPQPLTTEFYDVLSGDLNTVFNHLIFSFNK